MHALRLILATLLSLGVGACSALNSGSDFQTQSKFSGASPGQRQLWILAGQSNAYGIGDSFKPPEATDHAGRHVSFRHSGSELVSGLGLPLKSGAEMRFLNRLLEKGQAASVLKVTKNGSALQNDWNSQKADSKYRESMWNQLQLNISRAKVEMSGNFLAWRWGGVLWIQGEADALDEEMSKNYEKNLASLISAVRTESGKADLPFIIAKLNRHYSFTGATAETISNIRAAQEAVSERIENVFVVDTDHISLGSDHVHYNKKGLEELGSALAECALDLSSGGKKCKASQHIPGCYVKLSSCSRASTDELVWTAEGTWFRDPDELKNKTQGDCFARSSDYLSYCGASFNSALQVQIRFNDGAKSQTVNSRLKAPPTYGCHIKLSDCSTAATDKLDWTVTDNWFRDPESNWKNRIDFTGLGGEQERCLARKAEYLKYCSTGADKVLPTVDVVYINGSFSQAGSE